jgi:CBS domain-containing protein
MQIREIMTRDVEVIPSDAPVREAATKMKYLDVGVILVCDGQKLAGLVTDRDIAVRVVAEGRDSSRTKVSDVMTTDISYCFEDQEVDEAASLMEVNQIRRLPILDREKRLVGILSLGDISVRTEGTEDQDLAAEALEEISEPAAPKR